MDLRREAGPREMCRGSVENRAFGRLIEPALARGANLRAPLEFRLQGARARLGGVASRPFAGGRRALAGLSARACRPAAVCRWR